MIFQDQKAIYMQIADFICENILTDRWPVGERVPSVREMAGEIQVNPNTVMRSYTYLQEMQILYNKRGIGYFVADDATTKIQSLKKESFIRNALPDLFRTMDLLKIDFDELKKLYNQRSPQNN